MTRWPALIGALATGLLCTAGVEFLVRRGCPPSVSSFAYQPRAHRVEIVRTTDAAAPLQGLAVHAWAWRDLDMADAPGGGAGGGLSALARTADGQELADTPAAVLAQQYGLMSLLSMQPLDAYFGAPVRLRATSFGFPFASSVREVVAGVRPREPQGSASTAAKPAPLAVALVIGAAWSHGASEAHQHVAANGGTSTRQWLLPLGVGGNTLTFALVSLALAAMAMAARDHVRRRGGRCTRCGYALHGLRGGACPECGAP